MKRTLVINTRKEEEENEPEILPQELWPCILAYLRLWQRYRYATVCKAWAKTKGLIDQSVESIEPQDHLIEPINLSKFVNLTRWVTTHNSFVGTTLFNNLRSLYLTITYDSGKDIDPLNLLSQLTSLRLRIDYLCRPSEISLSLSKLTRLEIGYNGQGEDEGPRISDSTFLSSPVLSKLNLHSVRINPHTLVNISSSLKDLTILNTKDKDVIRHLTNLDSLAIDDERYEKGMFSSLTKLTALTLWDNRMIGNEEITHLTSLRSLELYANTMITDQALPSFPLLTSLCVIDSGPRHYSLMIDGCLNGNIPKLTNLRKLVLTSFGHGDQISPCLSQLTQLTSLHAHIYHSGSLLSTFTCLTNLVTLRLFHLHSIDADTLPVSLRKLDLRGCFGWKGLSGTGAPHLTNLGDLMIRSDTDRLSRYFNDFSSLPSLKRIHYSSKTVVKRHSIKNIPDCVELITC